MQLFLKIVAQLAIAFPFAPGIITDPENEGSAPSNQSRSVPEIPLTTALSSTITMIVQNQSPADTVVIYPNGVAHTLYHILNAPSIITSPTRITPSDAFQPQTTVMTQVAKTNKIRRAVSRLGPIAAPIAAPPIIPPPPGPDQESSDPNDNHIPRHPKFFQASSTSTASTTIFRQLCSPSCFACNTPSPKLRMPRRDLTTDNKSEKALSKRKLTTPENYDDDIDRFILSELDHADELTVDIKGVPTAMIRDLMEKPYNAGVRGLKGCTSIIVVSRKAVWLSHFYEVPSFRSGPSFGPRTFVDRARFDRDVLQTMKHGDSTTQLPGLEVQTVAGGRFHSENHPLWVIVTPRDGLVRYTYSPEVAQISKVLQELFPGAPNNVVQYYPKPDDNAQLLTAAGKILFQYDPAEDLIPDPCQDKVFQRAKFRLWVETKPIWSEYWRAEANQVLPELAHNPMDKKKRNNPACKILSMLPLAFTNVSDIVRF